MNTQVNDPLVQCLIGLSRHHGTSTTVEALVSGLPLEAGLLTPRLFARASQRIGLTSNLVKQQPSAIVGALLPAVILSETGQACLLMSWHDGRTSARVIYPELLDTSVDVSREALEAFSNGTAIVCQPKFKFDERAPKKALAKDEHWFWSAVRRNLPVYRDVLIAAFFINLFALALPLFTMNVYDRVVPNHAVETLWTLAIGLVIVVIMDFTLRMMRSHFLDLASERIDIGVSAQIMERVLGSRLEHRPASVGTYAVNLRAFDSVRDFINSATITTLIDVPFAVIFCAVIFWIAPMVLLPLILGVILVLGYVSLGRAKLRELSESTHRAGIQRNATLIESLVGLDTIKALGAESKTQRRWEEATAFLARTGVQLRMVSNSNMFVTAGASQLVTLFVVVTGVYLITEGELSMGGLIACSMLSGRVMAPVGQMAGMITQFQYAQISLGSVEQVMETPQERPEGARFLSRDRFNGDIEFKKVSFAYPGSEVPSLVDVSFKIKQGEKVAILGRVGSGKTTLQKLAMGLFQPTDGAVLVDGIDLRQLDPAEFRKQVGYMPQDITLFHGTLRENIVLSHPYVNDAEILKAAEIANLTEFINRHPQGFDMMISERGDSLSGGQRRCVALSRAILNDPGLMLMDEPTGSMDHSTEMAVKQQLAQFIEGRTWIVVTHRNSLLEMVDRILVIDNGRIVADGPRASVVAALQQGKIGKA
ncbi:type I secretion system permease/ATPase [Pseudomonadales bacterium]|nr:type I secretion system permease/ATPase [Pseudomonadales bacterium]